MCHLVVGHNDNYVVRSQNTLNFLYICYNVLQNSVLLMLLEHKIGGVFGLRSCVISELLNWMFYIYIYCGLIENWMLFKHKIGSIFLD